MTFQLHLVLRPAEKPHSEQQAPLLFEPAAADTPDLYAETVDGSQPSPPELVKAFTWFTLNDLPPANATQEQVLRATEKEAERQYALGIQIQESNELGAIEQAHKAFYQAAMLGHADAQFRVGCYFREDKMQALHWFMKAAHQNHTPAQERVSEAYQYGDPVKQSNGIAFYWLNRAAELGYVHAQCRLGRAFMLGTIVAESSKDAAKWLTCAALQGDTDSQYWLGQLYASGRGVEQSAADAKKWYEKAALEGHTSARFELSKIFFSGQGVERSVEKANEWYMKALHSQEEDNLLYG